MNRALLADLQQRRCYPSVTILLNTTPAPAMAADDRLTALRLVEKADRRLADDVDGAIRTALVLKLTELVAEQASRRTTIALAVCVSPEHSAVVPLGRPVDARVVIDDTFATRDLVADLNRTALYRVVTISDRRVRLFVGDRQRLVEERTPSWPLERTEDQNHGAWMRHVIARLAAEEVTHPLPTVFAGVDRTVRHLLTADSAGTVGVIGGNHDRTSHVQLHHAAWPLVTDWLRGDRDRALARLDEARSARRYASGIDEMWALANDGRVELVVAEEGYRVAARLGDHHQLVPADDAEAPDVVDDVVDDTIEHVLRCGGEAVLVPDGDLSAHGRIAGILRY